MVEARPRRAWFSIGNAPPLRIPPKEATTGTKAPVNFLSITSTVLMGSRRTVIATRSAKEASSSLPLLGPFIISEKSAASVLTPSADKSCWFCMIRIFPIGPPKLPWTLAIKCPAFRPIVSPNLMKSSVVFRAFP